MENRPFTTANLDALIERIRRLAAKRQDLAFAYDEQTDEQVEAALDAMAADALAPVTPPPIR